MKPNGHLLTTTIAVRYLDAARTLYIYSPVPNALWEQLNHLFAMSAELALKAFLERNGVSERDLRDVDVRHSLSGLLQLSVHHGLRTNRDVADTLLDMDDAHSSHAYRYVPRPTNSDAVAVHSAHPKVALSAIQRLLDQCAPDPAEMRAQSIFPDDWPPASLPLHPLSTEHLKALIEEKRSFREFTRRPHAAHE